MPAATFGPILTGLAILSIWAAGGIDAIGPGRAAAIAASIVLFVIRYRLWDDVADREIDRRRYPGRPAVRLDVAALTRIRWGLTAMHVVLFAVQPFAAVAVVVVDATFVVAYSVRPHLGAFVWRYPVLLAKYPAFVVTSALVGDLAAADRLLAAAAVAYAAAWLYEALHDPHPRGAWS
jgi:hypothetical protein